MTKNCAGAIIVSNRKNIEISKLFLKISFSESAVKEIRQKKKLSKNKLCNETQNLEMDLIKKPHPLG